MFNVVRTTKAYGVRIKERLQNCHHSTKKAAVLSHCAYGGAVFIEGHGVYPILAGVLAVVIVVEYLAEE